MAPQELEKARTYILMNCEEVSEYANHKNYLSSQSANNIDRRHDREFFKWFKQHILKLHSNGCSSVTEDLFALARGPDSRVYNYTSYMINGWRFNTKDRDMLVKSQNSGVFVQGDDESGNKDYFGVLTDIIKLTYGKYSVVLFKCDWWDVHATGRGVKTDRHGFTLINTSRTLRVNDPYILATQAEQVYYVKDTVDPKWLVVVKAKPRDLYDVPPDEDEDEESDITISNSSNNEACQENEYITVSLSETMPDDIESTVLKRLDVECEAIVANPKKQTHNRGEDDEEEEEEDSESDGAEYMDTDDSGNESDEDDSDDS
ncbi:hypothetical protein EJB05_15347, partial [Eragrostis curvula]